MRARYYELFLFDLFVDYYDFGNWFFLVLMCSFCFDSNAALEILYWYVFLW